MLVEISAQDRLGRRQTVSADLYVAGDTPVAWEQPKANVFETTLDKTAYDPGEVANLLLKSPFQSARALIIVEGPKANQYHWVNIENGQGVFPYPDQWRYDTARTSSRAAVARATQRGAEG